MSFFDPKTSHVVELPSDLSPALEEFLERRPDWDLDRVMSAAISHFLLQNACGSPYHRKLARVYLDSLFKRPFEGGENGESV